MSGSNEIASEATTAVIAIPILEPKGQSGEAIWNYLDQIATSPIANLSGSSQGREIINTNSG